MEKSWIHPVYIPDTALKVSHSLYCFTTSVSHGVDSSQQVERKRTWDLKFIL